MADPALRGEKNHSGGPRGHRSTGQDQSTGTNRTGVEPGQVPALPAASSVPAGPENGGGEHINPVLTLRSKPRTRTRNARTHTAQVSLPDASLRLHVGKKKKKPRCGHTGEEKGQRKSHRANGSVSGGEQRRLSPPPPPASR